MVPAGVARSETAWAERVNSAVRSSRNQSVAEHPLTHRSRIENAAGAKTVSARSDSETRDPCLSIGFPQGGVWASHTGSGTNRPSSGGKVRAGFLAVTAVIVLFGSGCVRSSPHTEQELCPQAVEARPIKPLKSYRLAKDIELGPLRCADPGTGMSSIEVTITNSHPLKAAWYEVTLQFMTSDGHVFATDTVRLDKASAGRRVASVANVARPLAGHGIAAQIIKVDRRLDETPPTEPANPSAPPSLEATMRVFLQEGLVPANTPYGVCPVESPQEWWIGARSNCWIRPRMQPGPAPSATAPRYGSAVCADGWTSRSTGRGTCSHHGGIAH